jgi:hypothetical protein
MTALLLGLLCAADISGGAATVQPTYAELRQRVERLPAGQTITLAVGQDSPGATRCDDAKTHGIDAGLYSCWSDGSVQKMQRIVPVVHQPANVQPVSVSRPVVTYFQGIGSAIVQPLRTCNGPNCPK